MPGGEVQHVEPEYSPGTLAIVLGDIPDRSTQTLLVKLVEELGKQVPGDLQVKVLNLIQRPLRTGEVPHKDELTVAKALLFKRLEELEPKLILTMGAVAFEALHGPDVKLSEIQGVAFYNKDLQRWYVPTLSLGLVTGGQTGYFDSIYDDVQRAVLIAGGLLPVPKQYDVDWEYVDTEEKSIKLFEQLWKYQPFPKRLSLDTESMTVSSVGPRPLDDRWIMFQISNGVRTYSFRVVGANQLAALDELIRNTPETEWWFHNKAYDLQVLSANGVSWPKISRDSMCLALGLTEHQAQTGLKYLSRKWLNAPYYEQGLEGYSWQAGPQTPEQWYALAKYGAYDAYNTWHLPDILEPLVKREGTYELATGHLEAGQEAFANVESHGTKIDIEYANGLEAEWLPIIEEAERNMQAWAKDMGFPADPAAVGTQMTAIPCPQCVGPSITFGPDRREWRREMQEQYGSDPSCTKCMKRRFVLVRDDRLNVRSPKQLQHLAFDILGMPSPPSAGRSTDANFLKYNENSAFTKYLTSIREKDHLLRNYIRGITDDVWSDGRIHPDFLIAGTRTGRLSIHNPPMQTIPKWGVDPKSAKLIRRMIVASPGMTLLDVDYSNLELFVAHHYSKDENLLRALTEHNFHTFTASGIFDVPYEEVTGMQRFQSKFVTFGIAYGRQAYSLAMGELKELCEGVLEQEKEAFDLAKASGERARWPRTMEQIAQGYVDRFWNTYPLYKSIYDEWKRQAIEDGELRTPFGRVRRWRLITGENRRHIENQAVNFPIQSLASDICLSALIRLSKLLPKKGYGHVLFTVHDSLVFEVYNEYLEEAVALITQEMQSPPFETTTPFRVEVEYGPNLGEVKAWEE